MKPSHVRPALLLLLLSACSNSEVERLQRENAEAKAKLQTMQAQLETLSAENARLKETDQSYFTAAMDALQVAHSPDDLQKALLLFQRVRQRFPNSSLVPKAQTHEREIQTRLDRYEEVQRRSADFESALADHAFARASEHLEALRPIVSKSEREALEKRLIEERDKPLATSINRLITMYSRILSDRDTEALYRIVGSRVTFPATVTSVNRERMSIQGYSEGWGKGSSIEVFYQGSNLEGWLTDHDPECCENRFQIVGKLAQYSNTGTLYVTAESITPLK